jgi:hypothetical protein
VKVCAGQGVWFEGAGEEQVEEAFGEAEEAEEG